MKTATCSSCNETKKTSEFGRTKQKGMVKKTCTACEKERANATHKRWRGLNKDRTHEFKKRWEANNSERHLEYMRRANKKSRRKKSQKVFDYLFENPCIDCGEADVRVLDFDHVRGEKVMAVRNLLSRSANLEKIFAEIAKCEVRCANCHRRVTVERGNLLSWIDWPEPSNHDM